MPPLTRTPRNSRRTSTVAIHRVAILVSAFWISSCERPASRDAETGDAAQGKLLLAQYHCGSCHTIPGVASARGRVAVTLASFGRRSYIAGKVPNNDEQLVRWIIDPASVVPLATMPSMGVSFADARDMAAYLRQLQ